MKCKICGGTGTSNTCVNGTFKPCSFCDGTGEYEPFDLDVELDKLYPTEQTNEEWFCNLPTEEKAKWIADKINEVVDELADEAWNTDGYIDRQLFRHTKNGWLEWLKQPHRER